MALESIATRPTLAPYAVDPGIQDEMEPAVLQAIAIADLLSVAKTGQLAPGTVAHAAWAMQDLLRTAHRTMSRRTDGTDGGA